MSCDMREASASCVSQTSIIFHNDKPERIQQTIKLIVCRIHLVAFSKETSPSKKKIPLLSFIS